MDRAKVYWKHRLEIFRFYVTEDRTREEAKLEFERKGLASEPLTIDQWNTVLRDLRIFKNIRGEDAVSMQSVLEQTPGEWCCLAFAGDVLLNNNRILRHNIRRKSTDKESSIHDGRHITWFYLPFKFTAISDPAIFKNFQELLFTTRIHFESSFISGKWAPDHKGLYARSTTLRAQLAELSTLHNRVSDALNQHKAGERKRSNMQIAAAFRLHRSIVGIDHHRQLPDILAILVLMWRHGHKELQRSMAEDLAVCARISLLPNDPRRIMFECMTKLDLDQVSHVYLAFDTYCRHLWMAWISRMKHDTMKAYFSYNQASFPRADPGGFYSLFQGMTLGGVLNILERIDRELGKYSHECFILWHTAIRYLWSEKMYLEMAFVSDRLCKRVNQLGVGFDYTQHRQLNFDASLTFYLLGQAQEAQGFPCTARGAFAQAVQLQNQVLLSEDTWDPAKGAALTRLMSLDIRLGNLYMVTYSIASIAKMYPVV
ncbi:hypothetical protein BJX76DRAFT_355035 [Aspergillus varians]